MTALKRYQFRLPIDDERRIEDAAREAGIAPNQFAKRIVQAALRTDAIDSQAMADDLLVIRAGMEALFRRNGKLEELIDAIDTVRERRSGDDAVSAGRVS